MNKLLKGLLIIALAFTFVITSVSADEKDPQVISENTNETTKSKVNLYLFRKAGCHFCANELVYLDKIINKYNKKINIITYDILEGNNSKLLDDVAASLKHEVRGVPFTVVGDKFLEGFGEGLESDLIKLIEDGYDNQVDDLVSNSEFKVVIDDKKAKEFSDIEKKYLDAKYELPLTQDVVNEFASGKPNQYKLQIRQIIVDLTKEGKLVKLSNDFLTLLYVFLFLIVHPSKKYFFLKLFVFL